MRDTCYICGEDKKAFSSRSRICKECINTMSLIPSKLMDLAEGILTEWKCDYPEDDTKNLGYIFTQDTWMFHSAIVKRRMEIGKPVKIETGGGVIYKIVKTVPKENKVFLLNIRGGPVSSLYLRALLSKDGNNAKVIDFYSEPIQKVEITMDNSRYPHECPDPNCKSPAYVSGIFGNVECTNKKCRFYKE